MKSARVPAPAARRPGSPKTVDTLVRVAASPTTERWSSCSIPSPVTLSFKKNVKSEYSWSPERIAYACASQLAGPVPAERSPTVAA